MSNPRLHQLLIPSLIIMVVLAWFSPWWLGGKVLAPLDLQNRMMSPWRAGNEKEFAKNHIVSDGVDQYLVYRLIAERSFKEEGRIGWSSLTYGGTAEYANTMALYDDWTMQLHRWFDFWTAWHLGLMGQVLLAALGMWFFLRGRGISSSWACCGSLAYAANSQFVTWIFHRWALSSFCWVPWILWAIDRYRGGQNRYWVLVPLFIGMGFLGGTLQHGALIALVVAAMWAEEAIQARKRAREHCKSIDSRAPSSQLALISRYAVWGLLGAGLAAIMLVPCVDAFLISNRLGLHIGMYGNADQGIYSQGWLQPLFNLAAYPLQIFPSILGRCDSIDVLKLFRSELFYVAYFGSIPVLIAFLSLAKKDNPILARLLISLGLILPLTPLVRVLYQRLFLLFIFGGILAFASFMQHSKRETKAAIGRMLAWGLGVLTIIWTATSLVLSSQGALLSKLKENIAHRGAASSFGYFEEWLTIRADRFVNDLMIWSPQQALPWSLLAVAVIGLCYTGSNLERRRKLGCILLNFAVVAEVSLFAARWVVWSDLAQDPFFAKNPETEILKKAVGHQGRVSTLIHPKAHMACTPFIPNTLAAYDLATVTGYDSIIPDGMLLPNESPGDAALLGRLGVTHLISWPGNTSVPSDWRKVWESSNMDLYENPKAVPRYAGLESPAALIAFHEGKASSLVPLTELTEMENKRLIPIPAGISAIRIAENHAAGWQYRVSGSANWNKVHRGPDACMEIELPESAIERMLELRYDPPARRIGLTLSMASIVVLLGSAWIIKLRPLQTP